MAIPTRFNIGTTPAGRFLQALQPQPQVGPRQMATTTAATGMRGTPPMRMRPQPPQPVMPLRANMMRAAMRVPTAPAPQAPRTGLMGMMPAVGTPAFAGLSSAAARGLQLSGYQDRPITTGQGLGEMFGAGMEAYTAERKAQQAAELAKQQRETDIMLKMMEIEAARGKTERDISETEFKQEKDLRGEFTKLSKDFTEAKLGFEKVQNAAMTKKPSGATDIALVFGYMKVLDPNSVVREGEFATAANAGGVGETVRNFYNKLLEGTLLTPKVRRQFISSARTQFQPYLQEQGDREREFIELSGAYNLDPNKVVRSKMPKQGSLARPYSVSTVEEAEALPKGSYVMIAGRLARNK